ncbi:MAG TPA: TetR/AcrR family transcriptional regulator [Solirubrobacterales bacterium]|jgi:AcrR family transcriptional regulator|nr:TetR/AcrR family transcriptional regulator [Solirubrobacterales bacterium]
MAVTPWGPSDTLRGRMLPPGPSTPAEEVAANQRERLFGAMVASVAERGYAATRVADLVEISGVSRKSFYALFHDKAACFQAAVEAAFGGALTRALAFETGGSTWEERMRSGFDEIATMIVEQPAAARMCLIEAFAAGPDSVKPLEAATEAIERLTRLRFDESPPRAGMPDELITALVGGTLAIVRKRLQRGAQEELRRLSPELLTAILAYRPPPEPLKLATRPPPTAPETIDAHDHGERALRALAAEVAERGYAHTTVDHIVRRASMSPTTFYAEFEGKEDAFMAAIDSAAAWISAAVLPAFRRNPDWPHAVRAGFGAMFNFLASRPSLAWLILVEVYAAGPRALERRRDALHELEGDLVGEGLGHGPGVSPIAIEVIVGGIHALAYKQVRRHGAQSLASLAPTATYLTLLPFVGPERACEVANGGGQARSADSERVGAASAERLKADIMIRLAKRVLTAAELASELHTPESEVEAELDELERIEMVEVAEKSASGDRYRSQFRKMESEWDAMGRPERERISARIGHLISWEVREAVQAGTFDRRVDRHLSNLAAPIDEQGWQELLKIHYAALAASEEVVGRSRERLKQSDETPIQARSVQTLFEMPSDPPPPTEK